MTSVDLHQVLASLSVRRPIFHSEADFQHELALELAGSGYAVRLEVRRHVTIKQRKVPFEIDLLVETNGVWTAIELKYVKQELAVTINNEHFDLADCWQTNLSRFDCLDDLRRVERLVAAGHANHGYIVFLTNEPGAWHEDAGNSGIWGRNFSIHEGRLLQRGVALDWPRPLPSAGSVTKKRLRNAPIQLNHSHVCSWQDYSDLKCPSGQFRYLLLGASASGASSAESDGAASSEREEASSSAVYEFAPERPGRID